MIKRNGIAISDYAPKISNNLLYRGWPQNRPAILNGARGGDINTLGLGFYAPLWMHKYSPFKSADINHLNCTNTGTVWTSQGRSFGGSAYIQVPTHDVFDARDVATRPFTFLTWTKMTTTPSTEGYSLFSIGTTDYNSLSFNVKSTLALDVVFSVTGAAWVATTPSTSAITLNQTHLLGYSRNTAGVYSFFLDGLNAGGGVTNTNNIRQNTYAVNIGGHYSLAEGWQWVGKINECAFYNRSLSVGEIQNYYFATKYRYQ